jgi:hypothetical protein
LALANSGKLCGRRIPVHRLANAIMRQQETFALWLVLRRFPIIGFLDKWNTKAAAHSSYRRRYSPMADSGTASVEPYDRLAINARRCKRQIKTSLGDEIQPIRKIAWISTQYRP